MKKKLLFLGIVVGLSFILCTVFVKFPSFSSKDCSDKLFIQDHSLCLEIANTPQKREQGLSGRKELSDGWGMLFVFDGDVQPAMWMKDMYFPLDLIWITSDFRIVQIDKNALPETYPETFRPQEPIRYVLEISSEEGEKQVFRVGDRIELFPQQIGQEKNLGVK